MNLNELTASKIKELRKTKGYTSEAIASDIGISKAAYSQMENGHVEITLTRIEALAKIFNVSVGELLPSTYHNSQVSNGSGDNHNYNKIETINKNNFFAGTKEELKDIVEHLKTVISSIE